jgi:hypothetical protein
VADRFGRRRPLLLGLARSWSRRAARAVLVGEALVKDGDPEAAVRGMTGLAAH